MNMIRHHDVCIEIVTFAIEMPKGILDNRTVLLCRQQAGTPTCIQRLFEFLAEIACILFRFSIRPRPRMRRKPICLRTRPFRDFLLRQGVGKAECCEARDTLLFPMRKVGARAIGRGKAREETWGWRCFARRLNICNSSTSRAQSLPWGKRRLAALRPPWEKRRPAASRSPWGKRRPAALARKWSLPWAQTFAQLFSTIKRRDAASPSRADMWGAG